jgi:hypothetical protein
MNKFSKIADFHKNGHEIYAKNISFVVREVV